MQRISKEEKIKLLKSKGLKNKEIGSLLDIHEKYVPTVVKRYDLNQKEIEVFEKNKVDILRDLQRRVIASITDQDLAKLNAYQKTTMIGILIDKERLLSGQSTSNQAVLFHIVEQACRSHSSSSEREGQDVETEGGG